MQKDVKYFVFSYESDILFLSYFIMKKITRLLFLTIFLTFAVSIFAADESILGIAFDKLRTGNITMNDIPIMILSVINFLLALAWSISVVALIYHAVKMQLSSGITGDSSGVDKAKKWMKWALLGFVLSMSAWFLMTKFIELLSSAT